MKRFLPWLLIFLISLPVILPLTKPEYFPTHDGEWAIVRLAEMHREIKDFQIPPRWSDFLNHGYGYPLFLYTYPFPYYLGELFHLGGLGLVESIKVVFIISVLLSGVFMYLLARELTGPTAAFIASALYIIAPFRLVDIYVRGSIGESLAFAVFPLLFWRTIKLILSPTILNIIITAISLNILILTHNIMALIFLPFWLIFLFVAVNYYWEDFSRYFLYYFLPVIILGLSLSAFFWAPAILEKEYITLSQIPLADKTEHFIKPAEFLNSPWNYGRRPSFQLGWLHILAFIGGLMILLTQGGVNKKKNFVFGLFLLFSVIILLFMTQSISLPLWNLPLLRDIDFPWRLLGPLAFFFSLTGMYMAEVKFLRRIIIILILLSILLVPNFAKPESYFGKDDQYYETNDATTTSMDELTPLWTREKPQDRPSAKVEIISGEAKLIGSLYNSHSIRLQISASGPTITRINTLYFPGWNFSIDGQPATIDYNNPMGIITLEVPDGKHDISGQFGKTTIRFIADIISLLTLLIISLLFLKVTLPVLKNRFAR